MTLVFSPKAAEDLEEIGDYIARDNPQRAVSFIEEYRETLLQGGGSACGVSRTGRHRAGPENGRAW
jgi:plasmid stabilization system protein ParE